MLHRRVTNGSVYDQDDQLRMSETYVHQVRTHKD